MTQADNTLSALRTLQTERDGMLALIDALEGSLGVALDEACKKLREIEGRVIVTGVGKSGHVGGKLAATLASTGTPAFFVHPSEANHGDLGMIKRNDAIIAISWSGETKELKGVLDYSRRFSIPLVSITRNAASALGKESSICLELPTATEACPNGLAPTTSTIMQMAIGDALAVALLESRGFSAQDFGVFHPGGSLGASLSRVSEVMHDGDEMPLVSPQTLMPEAMNVLSSKSFGCVIVVNDDGSLAGIFTDGDLARNLNRDLQAVAVSELMTTSPKTIASDALISSAMSILETKNISALIVMNEGDSKPAGILHLHDLLRLGAA